MGTCQQAYPPTWTQVDEMEPTTAKKCFRIRSMLKAIRGNHEYLPELLGRWGSNPVVPTNVSVVG